ncbi:tRNA-dihydrouridine synthase [Candidatus Uhrbacteria bacterium]|nr:tRNA-dihydrouridine synthase [Candidatus Uhrbacteria bacterium]
MFSWSSINAPIIGLSPMADMTDLPFCSVVRLVHTEGKQHRSPVMFREMVASEAIVRGNAKTLGMARFDPIERPLIQQIFGSEPETMARAAAIIMEKFGPDGIDINMGCPVYKLTSTFNGAALMKEPERASAIVRAIKAALAGAAPLSVKIRLGWGDPTQAREFGKILEDAGADLITVHGRTKCQAYSGKADWNEIGEIKKGVSIPVLANGDIVDGATALRALEASGADGVMVGRGALGNPWVFGEIAVALRCHPEQSEESRDSSLAAQNDKLYRSPLKEKISVILHHAELMVEHYGPHGIVLFRKHLSWYLKRFAGSKPLRARLMKVQTLDELKTIFASHNILTFSSL